MSSNKEYMKKRKIFFTLIVTILTASVLMLLFVSWHELTYNNKGNSSITGYRFKGSLHNPWLLPYSGKNFKYFSMFSYYIADNAYVHNKVYNVIIRSYQICEKTAPGVEYRYMEGSNYQGGPMNWHRSHQTGVSVDFMIPKVKNGKQFKVLDNLGYLHYWLDFDNNGYLKDKQHIPVVSGIIETLGKETHIDFESTAAHILALARACKEENIVIRKVIIKPEYRKKIFGTPSGKKLLAMGVPFASKISHQTNAAHDEHYHVDFKL